MEFLCICNLSSFFLFLFSFVFFYLGMKFLILELVYFFEWEILNFNSSMLELVFIFDWMSFFFMSFVLFISSLVIFYSKEYMFGDKLINRFIFLVLLFVFSMLMLILSPNLISILLGWDGLGLVSYCLVIYYQNIKSYNAGMITALSNRLGDVAFLLSIAWMLNYGSWNFVFYLELMKNDKEMMIVCLFMIFAAMTKSAQIPFSSWLPAAMAAPTPVSALVHSSTLVTAGVYLLIRFNFLFYETFMSKFLLMISGLTMFMAGLGANFEFDLKKIIALSTLSQLGLMMSILSLGFFKLTFFHLLTHALFKALLFMCAGSVIHNMKNSQDIRDMGSLILSMPLTVSCLNISNLTLCGMPFLSGFYSKDLILEMTLINEMNLVSLFLFFFSTGLTVMYSMRLFYYTFLKNMSQSSLNNLNDLGFKMQKSMIILMIMAILGGSLMNWLIFSFPYMICLSTELKFFTLLVCFLGGSLGMIISKINLFSLNKSLYFNFLFFFSSSMWFLPFLSTIGVNKNFLELSLKIYKNLDQGWMEFFGINFLFNNFFFFSKINQLMQNNMIKYFFILFIFWLVFLMFLFNF